MKILTFTFRRSGKVLFSVLIIATLASMVIGSLLLLAQQHHYLTARSATWSSEIPIAEAGVEEAMAHLNSKPKKFATNGWAYAGGGAFSKTRTLQDGYFFAKIYTNQPPRLTRIVSVGYARIPSKTNYTSRTVLALVKRTPPIFGIIGKSRVVLSGTAIANSYDSSDPEYSGPGGLYDPLKANDQAGVGTLSTNRPAISTGSAKIYGYAATGPGGSVSGNVGDGGFLSSGSGIQEGHVSDDFNMAIDNVVIPSPWNGAGRVPRDGIFGGVLYKYVLNNNDFEMDSLKLNGGASVYVNGRVRLWIKGDLMLSGGPEIVMGPNATLAIYMGGDVSMTGRGVVNPTGIPANCSLFGLPTCRDMKLGGSADMFMQLYAPQANVVMAGNFDFHGSMLGNVIDCTGLAGIHYDEALGKNLGAEYQVVSWEEL